MVTWPDGVAVGCGAAVCDWPQAATARSATGSSLRRLTPRASARGLVKAVPPPYPGGSPVSLDRQHTIHRHGVGWEARSDRAAAHGRGVAPEVSHEIWAASALMPCV